MAVAMPYLTTHGPTTQCLYGSKKTVATLKQPWYVVGAVLIWCLGVSLQFSSNSFLHPNLVLIVYQYVFIVIYG